MGSPWDQEYTNRNRHLYRNQRRKWHYFTPVLPVPLGGPQLQSFVPIETR